MAKKKIFNSQNEKPLTNQEDFVKPHQQQVTTTMDPDASEKNEHLKSLNQMLLKEAIERRQQVDSFIQSKGSSSSSSLSSENGIGSSINNEEQNVINLASNNPKKRAGRRKFKETRHPVYRGVRQRNDSWVCEVREPNQNRIWLGTYPTLEMAARAHDVAAMALRGRSACLNYADSAWRLPVPASANREDIQRAAAEAAEAFRPKEETAIATVESPENVFSSMDNNNNIETTKENTSSSFMDDDDEALFGMHGLLDSMAEGLMLPPPQYNDDVEREADVSLWSF
ncbi:hypothetical protein BUALT_Bualt06G0116800 [Buddleja alternifolia]|uniref:AP2/ERF domain-containing protein n=1 Tax=Buddleja alternifolia TaxID=168488 RepID=A0AAV6XE52_9LAMI|nr:hypothetical protein BUALT_Bualt06G0116800 [Buddleja alternifolia]